MTKRMLISVDRDESRAAVVQDGQLVHLEIEPNNRNTCKGNIYRSVVARVEPSLQSAFVDFGNDKQGFLPVGEIHPKLRNGNADKRAPIQELIRGRQDLLVQVGRDEIGQKGATLSTFISLPGRYLVLIPESDQDKAGVSRKLSDEARDRIKKLTETMKVPDGFGLIVRTAGETATETELAKDLLYLTRQWEHICKRYDECKGPTLLYAERSLAVRFVRDYFTKDIEEIIIDDDETLREVQEFLGVLMPRSLAHVHRYAGDVPMFARYGIEGRVEDVFARQVFLPSGGSIVIDQTEAMVAIDVNSGRVKEKDIEETARATNVEAAIEIAHQLMLRDMGGLVVIDFIDMREKKYVREVETALKDAFKNDKARTKIGHISEFGLLEMSRQRIKSSVNKGTFDSCPHCSGTGRIRAFESVALAVLRRIYEAVAQRRIRYVIATVPAQSARYLLNSRRSELAGLEKQYHLTIEVIGVEGMPATQVLVECLEEAPAESGAVRSDSAKMTRVHQELDLVRNTLVRREETRLTIEAAAARRGARVDYQEIYREVQQMAPAESDVAASKPPRRPRHESTAAAVVAEPQVQEPPKPRGFLPWFKSLFGIGAPVEADADLAATVAPALAAPAAGHAAGDNAAAAVGGHTLVDRSHRRDRGDRPERGDRADRGDRAERGERGDRHDHGDRPRSDRPARGEGSEARGDGAAGAASNGAARTEGLQGRADRPGGERPRDRHRDRHARSGAVEAAPAAPPAATPAAATAPSEPPAAPVADGNAAANAVSAEGSAGEAGKRRRRRRRRGGERGEALAAGAGGGVDDQDDDGDNSADSGADNEADVETAATADGATEAQEATAEASELAAVATPVAQAAEAESVVQAEEEVVVAQAVDAKALMQEEIAKLMAEAQPANEPAVAEPARPSANKRFVIDLRTPR